MTSSLFTNVFTVHERVRAVFFHQLRVSMEHHKWVSANAPPHSEACFHFRPTLGVHHIDKLENLDCVQVT